MKARNRARERGGEKGEGQQEGEGKEEGEGGREKTSGREKSLRIRQYWDLVKVMVLKSHFLSIFCLLKMSG